MTVQVPLSYVITLTLSINTLGCLYQMILTLDAYRIKNHLQIFALCVANVCLSASTILQYGEVKAAQAQALRGYNQYMKPFVDRDFHFWRRVSPGLMVCAIVSSLCSTLMCAIAPKLYREFAWALYQDVSPDTRIQRKYMVYQVSALDSVYIQIAAYLYHSADIPCFPQVHALVHLCLSDHLRDHQRTLYSARVFSDNEYHTRRPSASSFGSVLCSERKTDCDAGYIGKFCSLRITISLTFGSSFMQLVLFTSSADLWSCMAMGYWLEP